MKKRFDGVDKRFDGMDKRFDGMDKRFDGMDKRFDGIDKRLDGMDKRFDGIDERLDEKFGQIDKRFDGVSLRLAVLETDFMDMRRNMATRKDIDRIMTILDKVVGKLDNLHRNSILFESRFVDYRDKVDDHEERIVSLEEKVA